MGRIFTTKEFTQPISGGYGSRVILTATLHEIPPRELSKDPEELQFYNGPNFRPNDTHWVGEDGTTEYTLTLQSPGAGDPNVLGSALLDTGFGQVGENSIHDAVMHQTWPITVTFLNRNMLWTSDQLDRPARDEEVTSAHVRFSGNPFVSASRYHYTGTIESQKMGLDDRDIDSTHWFHPTLNVENNCAVSVALLGIRRTADGFEQAILASDDSTPYGSGDMPFTNCVKAIFNDVRGLRYWDCYMLMPSGIGSGLDNLLIPGEDPKTFMENLFRATVNIGITDWTNPSIGRHPLGTMDWFNFSYSPLNPSGGVFSSSAENVQIPLWG